MDAAKNVTASFTLKPVLTVTKAGNGTGTVASTSPSGDINCGTDCTQSYNNFTTSVTLTATPSADSDFTGWSGACSGTGNCVVTMDAAKTVTATFTLKTFTLDVTKTGNGNGTVTSTPTGINCGSTCQATYNSGTVVTLTASPDADSDFTGWSGACSGTGSCVVTMDGAKSVTANFALKTFTLTVSIDPAGTGGGRVTGSDILCGTGPDENVCSATYPVGTTIPINAEPDLLSQFTWGGDCAGTTKAACNLVMDSNKSAQVRFDLGPALP